VKPSQAKSPEEFRMNADDFDRIMGKALKVKPDDAKATKAPKAKAPAKSKRSK
jgi:hypothetical protein